MKVVVQNGAKHCLSRKDAEAILACVPESWSSHVAQVLLAYGDRLTTSIHAKERIVVLHCPWEPASARDKGKVASLLVEALAEAAGAELSEDVERACRDAVAMPSG